MHQNFWKNKQVLITGHTGFKGSWLSIWLNNLGANVNGYSLKPSYDHNLFEIAKLSDFTNTCFGDIRDLVSLKKFFNKVKPDIVFHLAAQPLVRKSYIDPLETYSTNVMGTTNVLEVSKITKSVQAVLNITSDKCYENKEWNWGYRENEPMGGHDPYSSSKGCAELITNAYLKSYYLEKKIGLASARAGNVIGGGDWATDRLIPDLLKTYNDKPVKIRFPHSIRPWQHVIEPLSGYLLLAEKLCLDSNKYSGPWNFGPKDDDVTNVLWIVNKLSDLSNGKIKWNFSEAKEPHEATYLKLDISKAKNLLEWSPIWRLEDSLEMIIDWHNSWINGEDMHMKCLENIKKYEMEKII